MEHDNKALEKFIDKVMSNSTLEQPKSDFTESLMAKVETLSIGIEKVYKPLIPKFVWWLIGTAFIALVGYVYFKEPVSSSGWIKQLNLSNISTNPFESISFKFSKTAMYALILLGVMISIQVPLLKYYFNKRISV
jgi:hypothetical protein